MSLQHDYKGKGKIPIGNGSKLKILHIGSSNLMPNSASKSLHLTNILHVPEITKNLISISQFIHDNDVIIEFDANSCFVNDKAIKIILLQGSLKDGLY